MKKNKKTRIVLAVDSNDNEFNHSQLIDLTSCQNMHGFGCIEKLNKKNLGNPSHPLYWFANNNNISIIFCLLCLECGK